MNVFSLKLEQCSFLNKRKCALRGRIIIFLLYFSKSFYWFIPTLSLPIWSTSHFVNSHLVNSHLVNVDKVGIDKVRIDEVGS